MIKLEYKDTVLWHDIPLAFTCVDGTGMEYLAFYETEETKYDPDLADWVSELFYNVVVYDPRNPDHRDVNPEEIKASSNYWVIEIKDFISFELLDENYVKVKE